MLEGKGILHVRKYNKLGEYIVKKSEYQNLISKAVYIWFRNMDFLEKI